MKKKTVKKTKNKVVEIHIYIHQVPYVVPNSSGPQPTPYYPNTTGPYPNVTWASYC